MESDDKWIKDHINRMYVQTQMTIKLCESNEPSWVGVRLCMYPRSHTELTKTQCTLFQIKPRTNGLHN